MPAYRRAHRDEEGVMKIVDFDWVPIRWDAAVPGRWHDYLFKEAEGIEPEPVGGTRWLLALRVITGSGAEGCFVGEYQYQQFVQEHGADLGRFTEDLVGRDALDREGIWQALFSSNVPPQVLTAVDVALWDLYGRTEGRWVGELLGERKRDRVKGYIQSYPNMPLHKYVDEAVAAKEWGYQGYKIHPYFAYDPVKKQKTPTGGGRGFPEQDLEVCRAVREAVGPDFPVMLDNGWTYDLDQSVRVGRELDALQFTWMESPMPESNAWLDRYVALCKAIETPVCAPQSGEDCHHSRLLWMERGATDVNRIDIMFGGLTSCLKVVLACQEAGMPMDIHQNPSENYQLPLYGICTDETMPWMEMHGPRAERPTPDATPNVMDAPADMPWLKRMPYQFADAEGYVHLDCPIPGMGLELDWDWINAHRADL
jgi:L-alanine-DL-glutamate epimerase-like enolase superfamily enzyme